MVKAAHHARIQDGRAEQRQREAEHEPLVQDGSTISLPGSTRLFRLAHRRFLDLGCTLIVPSPVLAQAWRGRSHQALPSRILPPCGVLPTSEADARAAGVLLGCSRTSDVVDAIVVATALRVGALVVTSDPDDIDLLWRSAETDKPPPSYVV